MPFRRTVTRRPFGYVKRVRPFRRLLPGSVKRTSGRRVTGRRPRQAQTNPESKLLDFEKES